MKRIAKGALLATVRTPLGKRYLRFALGHLSPDVLEGVRPQLEHAVADHIDVALHAFDIHFNAVQSFEKAQPPNAEIRGFEDLAWLFTLSRANQGVLRMDFDEAAYLYRLARGLKNARCVEIGRFKGGSTFLLAAALGKGARIISIDNQMWMPGLHNDDALRKVLRHHGLEDVVEIVVADSTAVKVGPESQDVVFVDGDHRYEGVAKDYHHWKHALKAGGHLLFHDAVDRRRYSPPAEGSVRFIKEIEATQSAHFERREAAGTLAHFVRTGTLFRQ